MGPSNYLPCFQAAMPPNMPAIPKVFLILLMCCSFGQAQVPLIFDTDFGGDADDLGALAMLHYFIDQEECDLLGIMCWSTEEFAAPGIRSVNRYYGHPEIPVGLRDGEKHVTDWCHARPLAEKWPAAGKETPFPDVVSLYRKLLSEAKDRTVVIVTVGPLKNIQLLLESKADDYSDLEGAALVSQKVKQFVIMGGQFPEGKNEWNFNGDMPGVTKTVLESLPVSVVFSGFEVGASIKSGAVFNELDRESPLYIGFKHFSENAPWMKENYEGQILDNSTFDQTAVLYAVRGGVGEWWELVADGYCEADSIGGNVWMPGRKMPHSYLRLTADPEGMAILMEGLMMHKE